jgi:hypothetical protein
MRVRAKMKVVEKTQYQDGHKVRLHPVTGGSAENDEFYRYTPAGSVELSTINDSAAASFEVGKAYYVDFTPAE